QAAYALALAPDADAERLLLEGLAQKRLRRLCARALVIRALTSGREAPRLIDSLRSLLATNNPSDRAAGAFGLSALRQSEAPALLASTHPEIVFAAARNAHLGTAAIAAARRLAGEKDRNLSLALSNALADPSARNLVPSAKLRELIQTGSAAASLAARALGARLAARTEQFAGQL